MLQLIDNTLMELKENLPSREELHSFCTLLFAIGVDGIELSVPVYKRMETLPPGRFLLNIDLAEQAEQYPGFYRYVCRQSSGISNMIQEIQINDVREILKLRSIRSLQEVRIVGLDDLICHAYEKYLQELIICLPCNLIHFCPENTYGCASALALEWLMNYGDNITVSFAGSRNNAATEELIMALRLAIRHKPNRDLTVLPQLVRLYEKFFNKTVGNRKPIIGKGIFRVESGIHADALNKNPMTYEAYAPHSVGGKSELVIGKHSGSRAVKLKMEELKLKIPPDDTVELILQNVKSCCTKDRKSLSEAEFLCLVREVMGGEGRKIYC